MLKSNFLLRSLSKPVVTAQRGLAPADLVWLAVVMFLWAICYPLIAVGLSHAPPLYFAALRSFVAGVGLLVPALALPKDWRVWVTLLGVGLA